jgi:hypothetical protein
MHGGDEICVVLVGKSDGKRTLGRLRMSIILKWIMGK